MDKDGGMLPPSYSPTILLCHFLCQNLYHCCGRGALYCVEEHKCQILHVTIKPLYKPVRVHQQGKEPRRNEGENDMFVID